MVKKGRAEPLPDTALEIFAPCVVSGPAVFHKLMFDALVAGLQARCSDVCAVVSKGNFLYNPALFNHQGLVCVPEVEAYVWVRFMAGKILPWTANQRRLDPGYRSE